ncbi:MAG: type III pantothenate kinase [Victivallales bacterium]|nr:type III pantothenate kinase [Victivallales bacterium]
MSCIFFLNIGNTHTQVAENSGNGLRLLSVYDTKSLDDTIPQLEEDIGGKGYAVCVVPALKERLQARYGNRLHFLSCVDFGMLDFSLVDTSTLGMDRIANAAAAFSLVEGPVIVVDCGTCVNTVIVDGAGRFLGGAISPGRSIMRRALNSYTAQLPLLELRDEIPSPIGRNTREAMAAGTDLGSVGALHELLSRTVEQLHEDYTIYATGGDAPYFLKALPDLLKPAPSFLTLQGVKLAAMASM